MEEAGNLGIEAKSQGIFILRDGRGWKYL